MNKPKILFYDIETTPLKAYVWGLGKQVVRHNQLVDGFSQWGIICITYCWDDGKPAQCIDWGYEQQNTAWCITEFDKIINQADYVIGKNNKRFDDKMLNAARMFAGLPGMPEWIKYTDDLEQQMRRYFRLPSHSLDYISDQLGLGGKIKMEFQDWVHIVEKDPIYGKKCFNKMCKYGKKDVVDTRTIWNKLVEHFEPKFNVGTFLNRKLACKQCGSYDVHINKTGRVGGQVRYREYNCNSCNRYAGRISCNRDVGRLL